MGFNYLGVVLAMFFKSHFRTAIYGKAVFLSISSSFNNSKYICVTFHTSFSMQSLFFTFKSIYRKAIVRYRPGNHLLSTCLGRHFRRKSCYLKSLPTQCKTTIDEKKDIATPNWDLTTPHLCKGENGPTMWD